MALKKTQTTTVKKLNLELKKCLAEIIKVGASSKGNNFEDTVKEKLKANLKGAKYITTEQWCSKDENSIFFKHYKSTLEKKFDFTSLPSVIDNGKQLNLMIVDKPNGSQNWPDILVVFNGIGFPIEIKSTKQDLIVWNSGLPRADSLYIFNCYGKSKTTCFLGQHAINDGELEFLLDLSKLAQEINAKHKDNTWSYYARDMFNSNESFFEDEKQVQKCENYQQRIQKNEKELTKLINSDVSSKRTYTQIDRLNKEIEKLKKLKNKNKEEYLQNKEKRKHTEEITLNFVTTLSWDSQQKTDFNFSNRIKKIEQIELEREKLNQLLVQKNTKPTPSAL